MKFSFEMEYDLSEKGQQLLEEFIKENHAEQDEITETCIVPIYLKIKLIKLSEIYIPSRMSKDGIEKTLKVSEDFFKTECRV